MTTFNAGDQMAEYERLDTPAPEGKVVAWRYRQRSGAGGETFARMMGAGK